MYVCICRSVTDDQIRREVCNGADSLQEVCQRLGVASGCGRCRDCAAEVVDEALREGRAPSLACSAAA